MKIIFLDFDGVMNNPGIIERQQDRSSFFCYDPIGDEQAAVLNAIVEATGAYVVISSSWRLFTSRTQCSEFLKNHGFKGIVLGMTPKSAKAGDRRGHEIQEWLDEGAKQWEKKLGPVTHFVILDDDSDMEHLMDKLVQTEGHIGLTDEHVPEILKHLND